MQPIHPVLEELIETGHISADQAEAINDEHHVHGQSIRAIMLEQHFVDEPVYLKTLAHVMGTEVVELAGHSPDESDRTTVPASIARMYRVFPYRPGAGSVVLAVSDFPSPAVTDDLAFVLSKQIEFVVASESDIREALVRQYGEESDSINEILSSLEADLEDAGDLAELGEAADLADLEHAASATPVIRFVNLVLYQAVRDHASDIHFEPFEQEFKIRYRVDGTLFELSPPPLKLALPIISRIKVIAGLDIAESRLPQDGRIQLNVTGHSIDFRVSTLPTQFGESVVLRVLDRSNVQLDLDQIGFPEDVRSRFEEDIQRPNGIIAVTGPTGSGKTTTLYAALQRINRIETKILTAEDPVEYDVEGIIQMPIRENIGLGFASALRSFLRQDPDVIMVGEIRDTETARIAIQASLTGHLVFTTLHTNDAPGAVTRLIDMEVEPYLIAATLEAVMGQRLLRSICPQCRTPYQPDSATLKLLNLPESELSGKSFYRGAGCEACNGSGFAGRQAIFEYLRITDRLKSAIVSREPSLVLRNKAMELGMRTMRQDGIRSILSGETTVEEVLQYTS
jgi:type IV pilus assembly protein PilB